jgi:hypothetical protein
MYSSCTFIVDSLKKPVPSQIPFLVFSNLKSVVSLGFSFHLHRFICAVRANPVRFRYRVCASASRISIHICPTFDASQEATSTRPKYTLVQTTSSQEHVQKGRPGHFSPPASTTTQVCSMCRVFFPGASVRHTTVYVKNF